MGIGGGIFLIALGAILTYGLTVEPTWLDLDVVGWVLMLAGATLVLLTIWFWTERRRRGVRSMFEETQQIHRKAPMLPDPPDVELRNPPVPPEPTNLPPPKAAPPPKTAPPP